MSSAPTALNGLPVRVSKEPADQPDVIALIAELDAYQDSLYPAEARYALDLAALKQPNVVLMVARDAEDAAVGCGAVVIQGDHGELKRMVVRPAHRGRGVARQVLDELEAAASAAGCRALLLETGPCQPEALAFYEKQGYARRGPFGGYPDHPLSVFMGKHLPAHPTPAERVVQRQLDAYNRRDLDAWLATYAPDAEQYLLHGAPLAVGIDAIGARMVDRFSDPRLHAELISRTVMDDTVVDHERVTRTFPDGPGSVEMICLYEVRDGLIRKATFAIGRVRLEPPGAP